MAKLVLHPTDVSQWYALLNEAQLETECFLEDEVESYLVFLLMRFARNTEMTQSVLAMDFLQSQQCLGQIRIEKLKALGDKSLLFSGLFPRLAERKHVSTSYFVDMGQTAYFMVAASEPCQLFQSLGECFEPMCRVLQHVHAA